METYRSYYNHRWPRWQNFKNFFFTTAPVSREGFFAGTIILFYVIAGLTIILETCFTLISGIGFSQTGNPQISSAVVTTLIIMAAIPVVLFFILFTILNIRRLHDLGESAWWIVALMIISLIPGVGFFWFAYALLKEGKKVGNLYGPRPETGTAIIYRYYDKNLSVFKNVVNFYFRFQPRLNRLPYFWGNAALNVGTSLLCGFIAIPVLVIVLATLLANFSLSTMTLATFDNFHLNDFMTGFVILIYILLVGLILANGVASLFLKIRRLHDLNLASWWIILYGLIAVIPFLSYLVILADIFFYFKRGTRGENKFGPDPTVPNDY